MKENYLIWLTIVFGGVFTFLGFYIARKKLWSVHHQSTYAIINKDQSKNKYNESQELNLLLGSKKRAVKMKKRRETYQEFAHPWLVGTLKGHTSQILDVDVSSNGKFVATCAEDRSIFIWTIKELAFKDKKSLRINVEYDHANLVRWSPDSKAFVIHKAIGNCIEVYKLVKKVDGSAAAAMKVLQFPKQHSEDIVGLDIACNGNFILTCSKANDLIIWDLKGQILAAVDTHLYTTYRAKISPCGRFAAASGFTPDVKVWEVSNRSGKFKITKCFDLAGHNSGVYDFAFNPDTSRMVTVSKDGTFRFYKTEVEFENGEDPRLISSGQWEASSSAYVALSPNSEIFVIANGTSISFYSTVNGKLDSKIEDIFNGPIKCLKFDSLGEYILIGGERHIKIFRNIPGYRASIVSARQKLSQKQTSATKERLEKTVADYQKLLKDLGEWCP